MSTSPTVKLRNSAPDYHEFVGKCAALRVINTPRFLTAVLSNLVVVFRRPFAAAGSRWVSYFSIKESSIQVALLSHPA
jgi:hypothetical protein